MAVYLISYIQRGNGTDTAFHRTYSCLTDRPTDGGSAIYTVASKLETFFFLLSVSVFLTDQAMVKYLLVVGVL